MTETSVRMSRVDTAWLRMDSDRNLMMIVGVWLLRPALDYTALCTSPGVAICSRYARFRQKVVQEAVLSYWVERRGLRHTTPCGAREARAQARAQRTRRAAGAGQRTGGHAAGPRASAVADASDRALRRRQRDDRAHPPLHRRRHRAECGADVDRRRRCRAAPDRRQHERPRCARRRLARRCGGQAADRPHRQGDRHVRRRRRQGDGVPGPPAAAAGRFGGTGAHRRPCAARRRGPGTAARRFAHAAEGQAERQARSWPGASRCRWTRSRRSARR